MVKDVQTNLRHLTGYLVTCERETLFQLSQKGTIVLIGLVIYPYFSSDGPPSGTHYRSSQCRVSVLREWMVPWTQALLSMGVLRLRGLHRIHLDPGGHCCRQNDSKYFNLINIHLRHSDAHISITLSLFIFVLWSNQCCLVAFWYNIKSTFNYYLKYDHLLKSISTYACM